MDSLDSSPVFTRCTISSNQNNASTSIYGGGVCAQEGGQVQLIDCNISGNTASRSGGGVAVKTGSDVLLVNCLLTGNTVTGDGATAPNGGGISIDRAATATLTNCTLSANSALNGGGIAQFGGDSQNGSVVQNSIVWSNTLTGGGSGVEIYLASSSGGMTISYSDIRDRNGSGVSGSPTYGSGVIGGNTTADDPHFVGSGNYHLSCASACTNVGNPTVTGVIPPDGFDLNADTDFDEPTPDLDLADRVQYSTVDMGCYEKTAPCCPGDTDGNNNVNVNDLLNVITHWGTCSSQSCPADVDPASPCGNGTVDVNDLLSVITHWGPCTGCGSVSGSTASLPSTYNDCANMCDGLTGQAWADCMNHCFQVLCNRGHTEWCQ